MKTSEVTDNIKKRMSEDDLAYFGWASPGLHPTPEQDHHPPVVTNTTEKREQGEFWNWLCLNGYSEASVWHATHKPSTGTRGTPDFIVPLAWGRERVLYIEFKLPGKWLSESQQKFHDGLEAKNHVLYVCYSAAEAIALVKQKDRLS